MDERPNFEGHEPRECGEHWTVGAHRAWCYSCTEWCYPSPVKEEMPREMACAGCRIPALEDEVRSLRSHLHKRVNELTVTGLELEEAVMRLNAVTREVQ